MNPAFTADQLSAWWAVADVVLPATEEMPSASAADPRAKWLGKSLAARPDLVAPLAALLEEIGTQEPAEAVARLAREQAEAFADLLLVAQASYYMNPKIRKRIGYPGQTSRPIYPDEAEVYLEGDLLGSVISRGPIHRSAS